MKINYQICTKCTHYDIDIGPSDLVKEAVCKKIYTWHTCEVIGYIENDILTPEPLFQIPNCCPYILEHQIL